MDSQQKPINTKVNLKTLWKVIAILISIITVSTLVLFFKVIQPSNKYNLAMNLYEDGKYSESIEIFTSLNGYKDSNQMILTMEHNAAMKLYLSGEYELAIKAFEQLGNYKDSKAMIKLCKYNMAKGQAENRQWEEAISTLKTIPEYSDSEELILSYTYEWAEEYADSDNRATAMEILSTIKDYSGGEELIQKFKYLTAIIDAKNKNWDSAIDILSNIPDYIDSRELVSQYKINKLLNIEPKNPLEIEVDFQPTTRQGFESLLIYMARHNIFSYTIYYDNPNQVTDKLINSLPSFRRNLSKIFLFNYPEYFSFFNTLDISRDIIQGNAIHINLEHRLYEYDELLEMIEEFRSESYNIINNLIATGKITESMTEKEKARVLYKWMAYNLEYDTELANIGYTPFGAIKRKASCQGYTSLYNMLCRIVGIDVIAISGTTDGGGHIWTLASLDGEYSYIDSTWGDPTPDEENYCDMTYFAVTKEFLNRTHKF